MNPFLAKTVFLHQRTSLANNGIGTLAPLLKDGGFQGVIIKGLDGAIPFKVWNWSKLAWENNLIDELVGPLHDAGLKVMGFSYCIGNSPIAEGMAAAGLATHFGLDGWCWDVEGESAAACLDLKPNAVQIVKTIFNSFRDHCSIPMAYCSWPYFVNAHPSAPAQAGLELCDAGMPMDYWFARNEADMPDAARNLAMRSLQEWGALTDKPIVPAGRAYQEGGWTSSPMSILAFDIYCRSKNVQGLTWWFLDHAKPTGSSSHPTWWSVLQTTKGFATLPPAPPAPGTVTCPHCGYQWVPA